MKTRMILLVLLIALSNLFVLFPVAAQKAATITADLTRLAAGKGGQIYNRNISPLSEENKKGIHLDAQPGDGVALVDNISFTNGVIECDIKGKDVMQQSFVGIAFHADNGTTYDAIYFRPFNFKSTDPLRRSHAVQYIAHPEYPWDRLRKEHPDQYEQAVEPAPDPNEWFHARIVVDNGKVMVYVDDEKEPSLTVNQLSKRNGGKVGLWVGHNSAGDFANLTIRPAK